MVIIYSDRPTNRMEYVFGHVFGSVLNQKWRLTNNPDIYMQHKGPQINYSDLNMGGLQVMPHGLIGEIDLRNVYMDISVWRGVPVLFTSAVQGDREIPFDMFSAIFYMISRFEEYFKYTPDVHGRFEAISAIAFQENFLRRPVVDLWIKELAIILNRTYGLPLLDQATTVVPTLDIDNAWAVKNKSSVRTLGALVKSMVSSSFGPGQKDRLLILAGKKDDPFDTFEKQNKLHQRYGVNPHYFFLLGDYGPFDKNIHHGNGRLRELVKWLDGIHEVGIHPSYASENNLEQMRKEIGRLEEIVGHPIHISRQHYIKLHMPQTYRDLQKLGIVEDRSMGFASASGFRAGTCRPFYFFDVVKDSKTNLLVRPFCLMDTTMRLYEGLEPSEALELADQLYAEVKAVGGEFNFVFHNESIGGSGEWAGWADTYEHMLDIEQRYQGAVLQE